MQKLKEELTFLKEKKRPEIMSLRLLKVGLTVILKENAEGIGLLLKNNSLIMKEEFKKLDDLIARANVIDSNNNELTMVKLFLAQLSIYINLDTG